MAVSIWIAGFGANPKPTVQSGWEEMEVQVRSKNRCLNVYLNMSNTPSSSMELLGFVFYIFKDVELLFSTEMDLLKRREKR